MPSLRHILHKHDDMNNMPETSSVPYPTSPPPPEIRFLRTDTLDEEEIAPPSHPQYEDERMRPIDSSLANRPPLAAASNYLPVPAQIPSPATPTPHRRGSRSASRESSQNIPDDLPQIEDSQTGDKQEREAQWEQRATVLAQHPPQLGSPLASPRLPDKDGSCAGFPGSRSRSSSRSNVGDAQDDINIQEAIRLHESGDLERSTEMFGQLADPNGLNNPLSQVLYGLALRHGWGCTKDEARAITYLSAAAANSAAVESEALRAGIKKGGAAKGELVLAIFELANCFRNGWGVAKDPAAARQYYETAANLGDMDAMNEVAWCYLEGFGGKKDKFKAAKYYRLAEESGGPTVGMSWIWKEKYNPK
ncbi:hypothetical protein N7468_005930 [Penicillium chermesinum]|uniref:HCP-like protein n=1 Tax=Penicillium chermesinum TaxID=63820 RepID=A0A9W9TQ61_9EURO|nr:uncharacterized protein N7468_005930 [Penicillium chermesinum]KAJ5232974.1 hypothetical protein N7468_005930 [Penicillium chermesinum]KAJ6172622.1 hypothetical protein N7470_001689 [Penicillium chermesinum]